MTLRDKIARALYENHRAAGRRWKAPWGKTDEIEKDAWRQDADVVLKVIQEDKMEMMSREHRPKVYETDINGDQ